MATAQSSTVTAASLTQNLLGDPGWWSLLNFDLASSSSELIWPGGLDLSLDSLNPSPLSPLHPPLPPPHPPLPLFDTPLDPNFDLGLDGGDMAMIGVLGPIMTTTMNPHDHFFSHGHHTGFYHSSIPQGIQHQQQDNINIQNATISPQSTSNPFFPSSQATSADAIASASSTHINSASTSTTTPQYRQDSPVSTLSAGSKRKVQLDLDDFEPQSDEAQAAIKRQRNTMAARKYRQKRLDRISDLERALADMTSERDELRLKLARREAEVDALREMLGRK
ncbi:hypothetical protein PT974_06502 [Cladobotryum mycophilum]|uniref:BZIP domain-containing protein n=1 Tax=Cladobotryum mycophilum TaxID=491253 RepID=A0ABR0SLS9_9HYPO